MPLSIESHCAADASDIGTIVQQDVRAAVAPLSWRRSVKHERAWQWLENSDLQYPIVSRPTRFFLEVRFRLLSLLERNGTFVVSILRYRVFSDRTMRGLVKILREMC
jgi:hypothetical protein